MLKTKSIYLDDVARDFPGLKINYPAITDADRKKIFGENLGKLLGVDTAKRRINL
jgi:predicted TIM-barrel fold metal-dependent hydrolase